MPRPDPAEMSTTKSAGARSRAAEESADLHHDEVEGLAGLELATEFPNMRIARNRCAGEVGPVVEGRGHRNIISVVVDGEWILRVLDWQAFGF